MISYFVREKDEFKRNEKTILFISLLFSLWSLIFHSKRLFLKKTVTVKNCQKGMNGNVAEKTMHHSFHFFLFLCDIFAGANGYEMRKGIIYCPVVLSKLLW